jgi:hypothetical protein
MRTRDGSIISYVEELSMREQTCSGSRDNAMFCLLSRHVRPQLYEHHLLKHALQVYNRFIFVHFKEAFKQSGV